MIFGMIATHASRCEDPTYFRIGPDSTGTQNLPQRFVELIAFPWYFTQHLPVSVKISAVISELQGRSQF